MTQGQIIAFGWQLAGWLAVPLAGIGIRWLLSQAKRASSDQHNATLALLSKVAVMAVTAAEQTIRSNPDKKAAALKFIDAYLTEHHIDLPVFEIEAAIESAVLTETAHAPALSLSPTPPHVP